MPFCPRWPGLIRSAATTIAAFLPDAGVYILNLRQHPREQIKWLELQGKVFQKLGRKDGECVTLGNLGIAWKDLVGVSKAIEYFEQQLEITREIGDRRSESTALWNLALAFDQLGERDEAIRWAEASLVIHEAIEDPFTPKVRAALEEWRGE